MTNFLEQKRETIIRQSMNENVALLDWQMIRDWLCNRLDGLKLSKGQHEKLKRYRFIHDQLMSGKFTEQEVISMVENNFENISYSQALQDLRCTKEIFNTTLKIDKRFEIRLQLDILKQEQQKCIAIGDSKTFAIISKVINDYVKLLPDEEDSNGELFKGHSYSMEFNPALLGVDPMKKDDIDALLDELQKKYGYRNIDTSVIMDAEIIEESKTDE